MNEISVKKPGIFYLAGFLSYLMNGIIGPLFIVYLLSIGLNPAQIGVLLASGSIATIIFEFPTGLYADHFGRRKSLLVSFSLFFLLYAVWFFSKSFYLLETLSILGGIAYTFQSGARDSLMIDNLSLDNDSDRNSVFARLSAYGNAGSLIGGLIAALLAFYFMKSIWIAASLLNLLSLALYLFFVKESTPSLVSLSNTGNRSKKILQLAKKSIYFITHHERIFPLMLVSIIFTLAISVYGFGFPVFLREVIKIPNYYFGFIGSLSALMGILSAYLGEKLLKRKKYDFVIVLFSLTLFAFYLLFGFSRITWIALLSFVAIEFFINGWFPVFQSFFNKFIPSQMRASVLSLNSSSNLVVAALADVMVGFLLITFKPGNLIIYSSFLFILIPIIILISKKRPSSA